MRSLLLAAAGVLSACAAKPNILMVIVDDLGHDDPGFTALQPQIKTPTLDAWAAKSTLLGSYYVQPSCSPTRTTILSGRVPLHTGVNSYIPTALPYGLGLNETTLADMLGDGGYRRHAVGKWHAGMYNYGQTPTFRGFESFFGFYNGGEDYFTHMSQGEAQNLGYDMRRDIGVECGKGCSEVAFDANGSYSTTIFTERAVEVINQHNASEPLFLYLAYQAVHSPDQAPESYVEPYTQMGLTGQRAIYAGMLACLDEGVTNVTKAWEAKGMMDNTIFILSSDNGGPSETCGVQGSSNWPLRGSKCSVWEGGTKAAGFVWSGPDVVSGQTVLKGTNYTGLMHAADWMPTLAEASGLTCEKCNPWDGVSQWKQLTTENAEPARSSIYYGITDEQVGIHGPAMRHECYKLILGDGGHPGGWVPPQTPNTTEVCTEITDHPTFSIKAPPLPANPNNTMLLFNLCEDPEERNELPLTGQNKQIADDIHQMILAKWATGVISCGQIGCPGRAPAGCTGGHPTNISGVMVWEPWCD